MYPSPHALLTYLFKCFFSFLTSSSFRINVCIYLRGSDIVPWGMEVLCPFFIIFNMHFAFLSIHLFSCFLNCFTSSKILFLYILLISLDLSLNISISSLQTLQICNRSFIIIIRDTLKPLSYNYHICSISVSIN